LVVAVSVVAIVCCFMGSVSRLMVVASSKL
jgi:hypothetical protein